MNFVNQILDELSGDTVSQLGGLLGLDDETAAVATSAAAPSLLAGLASLVTQSDGARKLTNTLGGLGEGSWGSMADLLGGDANAALQKGGGLLNSLFSATLLNGLANSIAKYAGINAATARNLLSYLAPFVLGKVAGIWRSRGGDASALTSFMAEQKENIADALPAGFSLADVPGLSRFSAPAHAAGRRAEAATSSAASWVVPLAVLLVGVMLIWNFIRPREVAEQPRADAERTTTMKPVVPEAPALGAETTALTDSLRGIIASAGETLGKVENAATAEAVEPKLEELRKSLDSALASLGKLPEISKNTVRKFVAGELSPVKEQIERVGRIDGLPAPIRDLIVAIVHKFQQLSGELETSP